jgi:hypothetical protein
VTNEVDSSQELELAHLEQRLSIAEQPACALRVSGPKMSSHHASAEE